MRIAATAPALAFALVLAGFAWSAAGAPLSPTEQRIVEAVKARSPAALELLERTVNVNSGTMNLAGVREVGRLFAAEFEALGFRTRWAEMPSGMQRAGHLIATREGKRGKRLLLIGHLDTVFEADSPVQLWDRKGARVRGQGVSDMKGGNVIILEALRALAAADALDGATITVVFSGDEERVGQPIESARADLIAAAKASDVALAFEGTVNRDGRDTATIGRRSSSGWSLKVTGKQAHSAGIFSASTGYGAIYEGARILNAFREQLVEPDLTFSPGVVLGGTEVKYDYAASKGSAFGKGNVVANTFRAEGDLRYLSVEVRERTWAKMRAIVAANLPGTSAEISFRESYPPMAPTEGNLRLLGMWSQASQDAGLGPIEALPPGDRGAGDVQFVAPYVDSLDGLGATGSRSHSPDEDLEIASIERASIRAAIAIHRLTR
jgi:glutamate carboxypeptidase